MNEKPELTQEYSVDAPITKTQEENPKSPSSDSDKQALSDAVNQEQKTVSAQTESIQKGATDHLPKAEKVKNYPELIESSDIGKYDDLGSHELGEHAGTHHDHGSEGEHDVMQNHEHSTEKKPKRIWNLQRQL